MVLTSQGKPRTAWDTGIALALTLAASTALSHASRAEMASQAGGIRRKIQNPENHVRLPIRYDLLEFFQVSIGNHRATVYAPMACNRVPRVHSACVPVVSFEMM